ncbi:DNA polymerase III subunit gamma and tau [Parafrigoribacterium humi]|uniref:DNA polymerase III subunit gamma and tau n=1 Tax=Parafrigoribacterium humi TaxID=3144664 RepID=UPI0032ED8341
MVTALYRRYRPETFAELIGQSQVTDPLRTALRNDRVNHAYLFSGPRGCGKTTSARILARCLNCAEGPTDTPCGTCASCVELSREGSGSLDVVEIDAASHNGVDDARDLRERAVFAPARDRYKIFILDEAHMVTPQGFNALLKIVEEPPEHVKFIFATTEPEKVIGTIRSRTHHYPFRLVPPAQMLEYVQQLATSEKVDVEPGVLPLVVRAGGGSVRDTLSLLDQLIAGSEGSSVQYERAVALLGYTHGALLGDVIEALGTADAATAFAGVDRVIQTGQDPRRFVEDLLERLRDLIVVAATGEGAAAVLRGVQQDELDRMAKEAALFGVAELSRTADVVSAALNEMTGATSPRLHLELMIARVLVPASDDSERGTLARVERLERRIGVSDGPSAVESRGGSAETAAKAPPIEAHHTPASAAVSADRVTSSVPNATEKPMAAAGESAPSISEVAPAEPPLTAQAEQQKPVAPRPTPMVPPVELVETSPSGGPAPAPTTPAEVTLQQVKDAWPEILEVVQKAKRTAWMVVFTAKPLELRDGGILVLSFQSQNDVDALKQQTMPGEGVGDYLKKAVFDVLGFTPKLLAKVETTKASGPAPTAQTQARLAEPDDAPEPTEPDVESPAPDGNTWYTAPVSDSEPETRPVRAEPESAPKVTPKSSPKGDSASRPKTQPGAKAQPVSSVPPEQQAPQPEKPAYDKDRYGESVVREILGASFIEEQAIAPRVAPRES